MAGPVSSLAQVPLSEVLPAAYADAESELRRLAGALESSPRADGHVAWHWYPDHREPAQPSDARRYLLHLTVNAGVEVGCWCPRDHNMHQVRTVHRTAADSRELAEGFAAGTAMLLEVLAAGPFDPNSWRTLADLPNPSESRGH
jgi:hypothetical protein